jgi:hypothetical protein
MLFKEIKQNSFIQFYSQKRLSINDLHHIYGVILLIKVKTSAQKLGFGNEIKPFESGIKKN